VGSFALNINSRILIVDDTPANVQVLSATLKEQGYQLSVALNGKQALDLLARVRPDTLVVLRQHVQCQPRLPALSQANVRDRFPGESLATTTRPGPQKPVLPSTQWQQTGLIPITT
jgi:CheY-like chemotaxis protein